MRDIMNISDAMPDNAEMILDRRSLLTGVAGGATLAGTRLAGAGVMASAQISTRSPKR
jgi:hypothetical protein